MRITILLCSQEAVKLGKKEFELEDDAEDLEIDLDGDPNKRNIRRYEVALNGSLTIDDNTMDIQTLDVSLKGFRVKQNLPEIIPGKEISFILVKDNETVEGTCYINQKKYDQNVLIFKKVHTMELLRKWLLSVF